MTDSSRSRYLPYIAPLSLFLAALVLAFLCSLFSTIPGLRYFIQFLFQISGETGFVLLILDACWFSIYAYTVFKYRSAQKAAPLDKCPVCANPMRLDSEPKTDRLGFPRNALSLNCPTCATTFKMQFPYRSWKVEQAAQGPNPDFSWLYLGEMLSTSSLRLVLGGHPTPSAIQKLRTRALSNIRKGDLNSLRAFSPDWLHGTPPGITINFSPDPGSYGISLQPKEILLLAIAPIYLSEQRTKQGSTYVLHVDRGTLLLTNFRLIFIGKEKSVDKHIHDFTNYHITEGMAFLYYINRKSLYIFSPLDSELLAAALQGLKP